MAQADLPAKEGSLAGRRKKKSEKLISLPYQGGGSFLVLEVGAPLATLNPNEEVYCLAPSYFGDEPGLLKAVLSAQGFLGHEGTDPMFGFAVTGKSAAAIFGPRAFMSRQLADEVVSIRAGRYERFTVYYFRSADDFDPVDHSLRNITFKRIPMDIGP
jgi:hypothetical protein